MFDLALFEQSLKTYLDDPLIIFLEHHVRSALEMFETIRMISESMSVTASSETWVIGLLQNFSFDESDIEKDRSRDLWPVTSSRWEDVLQKLDQIFESSCMPDLPIRMQRLIARGLCNAFDIPKLVSLSWGL